MKTGERMHCLEVVIMMQIEWVTKSIHVQI